MLEKTYRRNAEDWRTDRARRNDEARGIGKSALFNTLWVHSTRLKASWSNNNAAPPRVPPRSAISQSTLNLAQSLTLPGEKLWSKPTWRAVGAIHATDPHGSPSSPHFLLLKRDGTTWPCSPSNHSQPDHLELEPNVRPAVALGTPRQSERNSAHTDP